MDNVEGNVKLILDHIGKVLFTNAAIEVAEIVKLTSAFRRRVDSIEIPINKMSYLDSIQKVLEYIGDLKNNTVYLSSLMELDIKSDYVSYVTPVETDAQEEPMMYYMFCSRAIETKGLRGFFGVEFVHRYRIGEPRPERVKTAKGPYVEIQGDIQTGREIDLTKHFDTVSALRITHFADAVDYEALFPLKVIVSSGTFVKVMLILSDHDFVDIGHGNDMPCHAEFGPLLLTVIPKTKDDVKFVVDVLGKFNLDKEYQDSLSKRFDPKIFSLRDFGFRPQLLLIDPLQGFH
jgi:hypothetical protein